MTTTEPGLEAVPAPAPDRSWTPPPRPRRRWHGLVPIVVAVAVLMVAEGAVRANRSRLVDPQVWPSPELQKKHTQITQRAAADRRTDVVLVGDSMMDAAGDPDDLARALPGTGFYNASIAGMTLPVIATWTTRFAQPKLRPKLVVIGFSSNELNPRALAPESGVEAYRGSRAARAAEGTGSVVDRADALLRERSMLYRYRDSLRRPFGEQEVAKAVFDPELTASGHDLAFAHLKYLQGGGPGHADLVNQGVIAALQGFSINPENVEILMDMISGIREQGARVLLVAMPVTADLVRFHPNGEADYQAAMLAFAGAAERRGATFVQAGVWDRFLFADPVHVNAAGSSALTTWMAPYVQRELAKAASEGP
jgi:hypothetical protein